MMELTESSPFVLDSFRTFLRKAKPLVIPAGTYRGMFHDNGEARGKIIVGKELYGCQLIGTKPTKATVVTIHSSGEAVWCKFGQLTDIVKLGDFPD